MYEFQVNLSTALIAAAVSVLTILVTNAVNKRLAFFQVYSQKKLDVYSAFWAAEARYERSRTVEDKLNLTAALHEVCLLAPLPIYRKVLDATAKLTDVSCMSGADILEIMDLMRLDLEACRRLRFYEIKPVDSTLTLEPKKRCGLKDQRKARN